MPTDGLADYTDSDGDGLNNWQEWRCQTDPTNCASALRILSFIPAGTNVVVIWQSVAGMPYFLECATELSGDLFVPVAADIVGLDGMTAFTATNSIGSSRAFSV